MTAAGAVLAEEIRAQGPISFRRFMEVALYHAEYGYYRTARDPFGKGGDFYTAEQIQPVFGILMAQTIRRLHAELGAPADFTVVELGAGRREMAQAFAEWNYVPVDIDSGAMPEHFTGVVFSNEFFDALPVEVAICRGGRLRERRVGLRGDAFVWEEGGDAAPQVADFIGRYFPPPVEGAWYEVNLEALAWLERIARSLERGFVFTIDYGYTRRESIRFPQGTLMSYRRHTATENVLGDPGEQDLTAHVNFSALQEQGSEFSLQTVRFETLARTLLAAGEADQFMTALGGAYGTDEELRRRQQLKTLLFGMGETFRVLTQRKGE